MSAAIPVARHAWRRSRYALAGWHFFSLVVACVILRMVLFIAFHPPHVRAGDAAAAFFSGAYRDLFMGLVATLPLLFWFALISNKAFASLWHRWFLGTGLFLFWVVQIFLLAAEYFFFEEFHSRFNTVAVDYLIYPHEVFINIRESYPVAWVVAGCLAIAGCWLFITIRLFRGMWDSPVAARVRWSVLAAAVAVLFFLGQTIELKGARVSEERLLNELANNGSLSFVTAFLTRHLDYGAFYRTLGREEAYARARVLLSAANAEFTGGGDDIRRRVTGDAKRPRLNVVIHLQESLGSEFWGSLGRPGPTLTPEMDKLATEEGLFFTNIYASGNRTVRGLEGVLSSFPPLPGDSIVKRDRSGNVETLARVLKRDGYSTVFLYGGRGVFDGMCAFCMNNGYDRFIEQKHFNKPTFATIWGVSDEDLMVRSIEECRAMNASGKPFLATVLSVSNHKPYTYPKGRIPENPDERRRENAVKYADYSLGQFFKAAKKEAFWTNTIFVVLADHGARVYGSQSIPIHSYEIPLIIAGPAVAKAPARMSNVGCSLDVAPTILGRIGRPYETMFFGRDLLMAPPGTGRVLLNHNRDVGLFTSDRLVVLGLRQSVEFYAGDPKATEMKRFSSPTAADDEMEKDAIALYQVADDLYVHRRFRIDE